MTTEATGPWGDALTQLRERDPAWSEICCTNLSAEGRRSHIRGALAAGATRDELPMVLSSLGAPILLEKAQAAGVLARQAAPAER